MRDQQIEKDYVLSWILQGIATHKVLSKLIVFKGGTVLKKVYFENYRFSEDLDFTLLDNSISNQQIFQYFKEVFDYIKEETNIPLEFADYNDLREINFYIKYVGPLGGIGANKQVKVDISKNKKLLFAPEFKEVIIPYSDQGKHKLLCYSLEEILVEKLRSVMQRMQARDFFDIWYLLEIQKLDLNFCKNEFIAKCKNKNINPFDFSNKLKLRLPQHKARWQKSMKDQIKDLPDFEQVEREVMRHLKNLDIQ